MTTDQMYKAIVGGNLSDAECDSIQDEVDNLSVEDREALYAKVEESTRRLRQTQRRLEQTIRRFKKKVVALRTKILEESPNELPN